MPRPHHNEAATLLVMGELAGEEKAEVMRHWREHYERGLEPKIAATAPATDGWKARPRAARSIVGPAFRLTSCANGTPRAGVRPQ